MLEMETRHSENSLWFSSETYQGVLDRLDEVRQKLKVNRLIISKCAIGYLNKRTFNGFQNIIRLDLEMCNICALDNNVFDTLIHLNLINLAKNYIVDVDNELFKYNRKLLTVIFKDNMLYDIDTNVFSNLEQLHILDLSYNVTLVLERNFLNCANLNELYLNNCHITSIFSNAFKQVSNLTVLALNNNKIDRLEITVFQNLKNLRKLNLSDNLIQVINSDCFRVIKNVKIHYLGLNLQMATRKIERRLNLQNSNLIDLDLSNNAIDVILSDTFEMCRNLRFLKLMILRKFESSSIGPLKHLTKFELIIKQEDFVMSKKFWGPFKYKYFLQVLTLIFRKVQNIRLVDFSNMKHLQRLHVECLEPTDELREWNFINVFCKMPPLKKLVFKNLNHFSIRNYDKGSKTLKLLNLTGLKNKNSLRLCFKYPFLEYLNLSFSELKVISDHTFEYLVNLKHLDFEYSKLTSIGSLVFKNNCNLKILNCSHCFIEEIEDYSFTNLRKLVKLDLSHNLLQTFSENTFYGLNANECDIIT